jgi:putative ferrous iron transport protein C
MTLVEVKAFLQERHRAGLGEIATHFDSSPDTVRQMLGQWMAKGKVRQVDNGSCAAGCHCHIRHDEIFEWIG